MSAALLGPDDAAIGFSHSGASTAVLDAIAIARKQGARTIAVTSYAASPLAELAEVVLVSTSRGSPLLGENAAARIAQDPVFTLEREEAVRVLLALLVQLKIELVARWEGRPRIGPQDWAVDHAQAV